MGKCLLKSYLGPTYTSQIPQQAHPPLQIHKTHFLSANVMWLRVRIKTAGRVAVSFGYPGGWGWGREWLIGHHQELVTTHSGCLRLFALLMAKYKLEQHAIMPTTLPTEFMRHAQDFMCSQHRTFNHYSVGQQLALQR